MPDTTLIEAIAQIEHWWKQTDAMRAQLHNHDIAAALMSGQTQAFGEVVSYLQSLDTHTAEFPGCDVTPGHVAGCICVACEDRRALAEPSVA